MNLKEETLAKLLLHGKTPEDVKWVGSLDGGHTCTMEEFLLLANVEYDNSYGGNEVLLSLIIVGDDWWLERQEYDGSEWWAFCTLPVIKPRAEKITNLFCRNCNSTFTSPGEGELGVAAIL